MKRKPKRKRKPKARLVPAADVARSSGRDPRTVRGWIDAGELAGVVVGGRWYAHQNAVDELLAMRFRDPTF